MKPPVVVHVQDGIRSSLLEAVDEVFQTGNGSSDELRAAERLQAAVIHPVVVLDQVIDAHCRVAVSYVKPTSCREQQTRSFEKTTLRVSFSPFLSDIN